MLPTFKTNTQLSFGKTILFVTACIFLFILIAVFCELLTFWINPGTLKIVIREAFLRMPITIVSLHLFAGRVIKTYDPSAIYGKLILIKALKWTAIGLVLPVIAWLVYYLFHITVPFPHTVVLNMADKLSLLIKWIAISLAAGLTEEVLFRGHLFMILRSRFTTTKSILITSLIFGIVHVAMLTSFSPIDILTVVFGGIITGIMFSAIYRYTTVIWYAAIVHFIWDIFFIGRITTLAATQADANNSIIAFKLTTQNRLLTGGNFGLEAAIPCLVVYLLVTAVLVYFSRRRIAR